MKAAFSKKSKVNRGSETGYEEPDNIGTSNFIGNIMIPCFGYFLSIS